MQAAVVLARKGSKRLPGKNKRLFGGVPLAERTIDLLIRCSCWSHIIVSTDDPDIVEIARRRKVIVHQRPSEFSHGMATSESAALSAAEGLPDEMVLLVAQCTSPFTTVGDVQRTLAAAKESPLGAFTSVDGRRPSGNVYAMTLRRLRQGKPLSHERCAKVRIPSQRAIDVDTQADWDRAVAMLR